MEGDALKGKSILVGVTGGIAAYKSCELVSRMRQRGAEVRVVMTEAACRFVAPLTFRVLSGNPVSCDLFADPGQWDVAHVSLADAAQLVVIAPATANCVGKLASGIADDLLTTVVMATRAPVLIVPAMNEAMYNNPVFQANKKRLESLGYHFMDPAVGRLACGKIGTGRMPEPEDIISEVARLLSGQETPSMLAGRTLLVTAGPTREPIDPVRFITNRSSGKMGYALAEAALESGARVILVTGPTCLEAPPGCEVVRVERARDMHAAVTQRFNSCDCVVMAAAVADYEPAQFSPSKIKKGSHELSLRLTRTPDILESLGKVKGNRILVGFAAETGDVVANAMQKLKDKNLDLVVANDVARQDTGFESDDNEVIMVFRDGREIAVPKAPKKEIARRIMLEIARLFWGREG
ncbi:MAG TPA: bifunctional phosphopantothenoylcysteine decarboxylase/phosphopantothenate--cysteine ligase CoaBC [Firmicutes bacterium]|nr:bifunctional phosphopantothenoylcysteine decarboxylase/phosphopantothenate--cysteine ligase CoaBC [Bacillota bacterium]